MSTINIPDIEFEEHCYQCFGRDKDCKQCNGIGYIATDEGSKLLAFLRHWKLIPNDTPTVHE